MILDTNGNGKRDEYVEPNQPVDPTKDKRIVAGFYAVMPNPADGSVWGTVPDLSRAQSCASLRESIPRRLRSPRSTMSRCPALASAAADIDKQGVVWASLASGHLAASIAENAKDRSTDRKRPAIIAPRAGRSINIPVRAFKGIGENSAESSYYSWVDQHNTFGLGEDVPMSTGNLNDGLIAMKDGKMILLRVPYPMGFYAKGFDGRIDDPKAGWKGRGLWSSSGDRAPWLNGERQRHPSRSPCTSRFAPIRWRSNSLRSGGTVGRGSAGMVFYLTPAAFK